jgi:uncharacterized glyoxalase superfamily protein PhnB
MTAHFTLFVPDQAAAAAFWRRVLDREPRLDVPGMTEFELGGAVLGLMPEAGVERLFGGEVRPTGNRAELYLLVDDPQAHLDRAVAAGARPLSPMLPRSWGHEAGYVLDPVGTVVGFAR